MYKKLLSLEKDFFKLSYMSDKKWLSDIIHDDFIECGKSGDLFDKKDVIRSLLDCKTDRNITIYNFKCQELSKNCWIVNYITKNDNILYYRTSIWIKENHIQLRFHQASKLCIGIDLTEC